MLIICSSLAARRKAAFTGRVRLACTQRIFPWKASEDCDMRVLIRTIHSNAVLSEPIESKRFLTRTSRALPKFESYATLETASFGGQDAQTASEQFHGIGD